MSALNLDGHKLDWHHDRLQAWLRGEHIAPITIDCALTRACSYRCSYCYGQLQEHADRRMDRDVIFRFLDDAAEIGVKAISFVSDGESSCSPHLYDAVLRGRSNGLDMALGTNGYLLDDSRLKQILPALTYLRFNISAAGRERYATVHGAPAEAFDKVCGTIRRCTDIKRTLGLEVTIGLQMVLLPEYADQVLPLVSLARELGADYLVVKHCSDDERSSLGVDYRTYFGLEPLLREAEARSDENFQVSVKWSKILSGGQRRYSRCLGPPFILQLSGSGLVAPCGMLFNSRYHEFHIGNIIDTPFKEIWQGTRYREVMARIASEHFDARSMCGTLCLQHKVNEYLWDLKNSGEAPSQPTGEPPRHLNFI